MLASILLTVVLPAAFEFSAPGGVGSAMLAGTAVPWPENALGVNPGLISFLPRSSVEFAATNPYGLSDLYYSQLSFASGKLGLGGRVALLGPGSYQELTGSLVKGFAITDRFSFGAALDLHWLSIREVTSELLPGLCAGVAYRARTYGLGAVIRDFNRPALACGDALPARLALGASLMPVDNLLFAVDGEYSDRVQLRFGTGFTLHQTLTLAIGMGTNPLRYAGGVRCDLKGLGISYACSFHPQLKQSHLLGLGYSF